MHPSSSQSLPKPSTWLKLDPAFRPTLLIVEDDPSLRKILMKILTTQGYLVLGAAHGAEALMQAKISIRPIDLLISDLVLPGIDGKKLARLLGKEFGPLRVLFISGYSREALEEKGIRISVPSLLKKPFTAAQLLTRTRNLLGCPLT